MSRSFKRNRIRGNTTANTEKQNKRKANRNLRRIVKARLSSEKDGLPRLREVSSSWRFDKDGKRYDSGMTEKEMRK